MLNYKMIYTLIFIYNYSNFKLTEAVLALIINSNDNYHLLEVYFFLVSEYLSIYWPSEKLVISTILLFVL